MTVHDKEGVAALRRASRASGPGSANSCRFVPFVGRDRGRASIAGQSSARSRFALWAWLSLVFVLATGVGRAQSGTLIRSGPAAFRGGVTLTLTNEAAPLATVEIYSVAQSVPAGWTVGAISYSGKYQAAAGHVVWGPFFDAVVRSLTVTLTPPASAAEGVTFSGSANFDGVEHLATGLTFLPLAPPPSGAVTRVLPETYFPAQELTLTNLVTPEAGVDTYAVEEELPVGWQVLEASHFGAVLSGTARLRWGPFLDGTERTLSARLQAPAGATGPITFAGKGLFGSVEVPIGGASTVDRGGGGSGTIARVLPEAYVPGTALTVTLEVVPGTGTQLLLVEEVPPAGWAIADITPAGTFEAAQGRIKWAPITDDQARSVTYTATPPLAADGTMSFEGTGTFDEATVPTGGDQAFPRQRLDSGTASRTLPACYVPGVAMSVTNVVTPQTDVSAYGLVEHVPAGWSVTDAGSGNWSQELCRVTWGPFWDNQARTLVYEVTPPPTGTNTVSFQGTATFGENTVTNGGPALLSACALGQGEATRTLPVDFQPGVAFEVSIAATPDSGVSIYFVEEGVPAGWTIDQISHYGIYDPQSAKVKWPAFSDDVARTLTYRLLPPTNAAAQASFAGTAIFDGSGLAVGGTTNVARNLPPSLTSIPTQGTREDVPLTVAFAAADAETPATNLIVTCTFDPSALFPEGSVTLGSAGPNRTITFTPSSNASGQGSATIEVSDGTMQTNLTVSISVSAVNDPPTLVLPQAPTVDQGVGPFSVSGFNAADVDAGAATLRLALTNAAGTVTVPDLGSAALVGGANGSSHLVLEGSLASLLGVLAEPLSLEYPERFRGSTQLDVVLDDLGNTGLDGPQRAIGALAVTVLAANVRPHAISDSFERPAHYLLKLRATELLANDTDANDDPLSLLGVSSPSLEGVAVRRDGPWVFYEPAASFNDADSFSYTISDGAGGVATGTVNVQAAAVSDQPTHNLVRSELHPVTGERQLTFQGIPGRTYRIQTAEELTPNVWTALGTALAGPNGLYQFTDPDPGPSTRRYRSLWP